jgi:hypothetical protein
VLQLYIAVLGALKAKSVVIAAILLVWPGADRYLPRTRRGRDIANHRDALPPQVRGLRRRLRKPTQVSLVDDRPSVDAASRRSIRQLEGWYA